MSAVPPLVGEFETVAQAMVAAGEQFAEREAYVDGGRRLTYGQWMSAASRVAQRFVDVGVGPGDIVDIMLPASIDYAVAAAAAVRIGAIVSGINPRLGPREVASILTQAPPKIVVAERGALAAHDNIEAITVIDRAEIVALVADEAHDEAHDVAPGEVPVFCGKPDDPAVIIWTSGTTGMPKGAWFDHRSLHAAVATAGVMSGPFDRRLASTPFTHAGYMAKLWEQVAWGVTLVITPTPWTAEETIRLLIDECVTIAGGAPTQWEKIVGHPMLVGVELPSLRLGVAATAAAPPDLVERITRRFGCPLVVRYAMTECPSITGTEPGDAPDVLFRTVGRPQSGVTVEIRDDAGHAVPDGSVARIYVRSAGAMCGYWGQPELTAEVLLSDGFIRSGDLGFFDSARNLVLVGRTTDMYIRGGYNVYPLEVENVLTEHPAIAQAAVVGAPAPVIGEIGVAFIVVAPGSEAPTLDEVRRFCRERLGDYKAPDRVVVVDALPLTAMMKVDKTALKGRVEPVTGR